jgi:ligand-binding sensor protein
VPEKPKTEMVKSVKTEVNTIVMPSENIELKQILLDTLRSLKEMPTKEVIGRAAAVVNVVNSMINIQKTEIQIYNIQKRINEKR